MKKIFEDEYGNYILLGKRNIGVKNADGKYLNPHATKQFFKEQGYKMHTKNGKLFIELKEEIWKKISLMY